MLFRQILPSLLAAVAGLLILAPAGATLQGLQVGTEAPDFRLQSIDGDSVAFADRQGEKLTVVLFWSTWSRNSEAALSRMETLYRRYQERGLGVIAINADGQRVGPGTRKTIAATKERLGLSFPVLVDDGLRTFHEYGVIALPSLVILDPQRVIRYEMSGYPLVGTEKMVSFVQATIEGRSLEPQIAEETGYRPDPKALHYFNMGRKTLMSRRSRAMAEMWFQKAAAADEAFIAPRLSLGRFYLGRGKLEKAAGQYAEVLAKEPDNVVALCESAMLLAAEGQEDKAESRLHQACREDPLYTPCYYYLGYLTGRDGSLEEALPLFEKALEINRTSIDIHLYKGRMYEERQDMQQAAQSYRQALESLLMISD